MLRRSRGIGHAENLGHDHKRRGRQRVLIQIPVDPKPAIICPRWVGHSGYLVCDRCGSMWSPMLHGLGWLPLSCVDRRRGHGQRSREVEK